MPVVAEDALQEAVELLVARFDPVRIILFGSQARGTADRHSDVDLLVVCPTIDGNRGDLMVEMDRALDGVGYPRDVIPIPLAEFERDVRLVGTLAGIASRGGRVLYERH